MTKSEMESVTFAFETPEEAFSMFKTAVENATSDDLERDYVGLTPWHSNNCCRNVLP